jgi:hypothetical protein
MTDGKKDEPGKGPLWPSDRRPHATIDVQATEVGGADKRKAAAGSARPEATALPPPQSGKPGAARPSLAELSRNTVQSNTFLSHVAAGVAGAVLTLIVATLFGLLPVSDGGSQQGSPELAKKVAALETAMRQRQAAPAGDVAAKLTAAEGRLKSLEDQARTIPDLAKAQAKLAADTKALEGRAGSPELTERLVKIEQALASAASGDPARGAQGTAIADKLSELERIAGEALAAAKQASQRSDQELAVIKTEAVRLAQRFDAMKIDVEGRLKGAAKSAELAPVLSKLSAFEQDLQQFLKGEGERNSNAQRVLLTLEIANLKRAMDRGGRYAPELDAVRKAAGSTLDLAPLQRYALEGVPTVPALTREFRRVANAAVDAEAEPADASIWERMLSGARSIVRVRKTGHTSDDTSAEAVVGRMEAALKEGRLGEVVAQGAKLPAKAAPAAEDWLRKVQARHAVDQAIGEIEGALKATLAARTPEPATELKR